MSNLNERYKLLNDVPTEDLFDVEFKQGFKTTIAPGAHTNEEGFNFEKFFDELEAPFKKPEIRYDIVGDTVVGRIVENTYTEQTESRFDR